MTGRTVGQYEILEQLGSGGMGVVYKARDTKLGRTVALKFLPTHLSTDATSKQRFIQEARAASALDHANICTIHDIAEDDQGQLFIVMSYYDGQTLKYLLQDGSIELTDAVNISIQLARGLARAHEASIVHRDIKPANIMVTARNEVKILDFGVAKLSESADLTKEGSTIGTAAYMSPEQSKGESVDVRADVWSLGVVMYELLAGKRPFEGGYEAALVYAIINETAPSIQEVNPEISDGLAKIVERCLSKKPTDRQSDAARVALDLEEYASPTGTRAAPVVELAPPTSSVPSSSQVVTHFAPIAVAVLAMTWAAIVSIGLPDWVFTVAAVLMLLGLPALLFSAKTERERDGTDSSDDFLGWLTYKKAQWGGLYSMAGLGVLTIAFMTMRTMGIGPFGSLQASGALQEDAIIIVADFENTTGEEALASSVSELMRIALSQSDAINLMEGSDVSSALLRMERASDDLIDVNTAMEIAQREGAEAVVSGTIGPIGNGYVLTASMLAVHDGSELIKLSQTARSADDIIDAVDQLSKDLRERIGESIKSIRSNEDLDRVTTSSLNALRLYAEGRGALDTGDYERAVTAFEQAIEIDSTFAMAYRKIAVAYSNAGKSFDLQVWAATLAYKLRAHLPQRERWMTEAYYYSTVTNSDDETVEVYERIIERYPNETTALNNITLILQRRGEYARAEGYLERALELGSSQVYFSNMMNVLSAQKKWDRAEEVLDDWELRNPSSPGRAAYRWNTAMNLGDYEAADTLIHYSEFSQDDYWKAAEAYDRMRLDELTGNSQDADRSARIAIETQISRGATAAALGIYIDLAWRALVYHSDRDRALELLAEGLERLQIEEQALLDRPYDRIAGIYGFMGESELARHFWNLFLTIPESQQRGYLGRHAMESQVLKSEGKLEEALAVVRRGLELNECLMCGVYEQAELLAQVDSLDAALEVYREIQDWTQGNAPLFMSQYKPVVWLEMGELYSRTGQTDEAIEAYSNFVDMWEEADASLQPKVRYARSRIERLLDQSVREPE